MGRLHWIILGVTSILLLAYMIKPFIDVIVYGLFIYYILRPLFGLINNRIDSRQWSAGLSILILVLPLAFLVFYTAGVASSGLTILVDRLNDPVGERIDNTLTVISDSIKGLGWSDLSKIVQENQDLGKFLFSLSKSTLGIVFKVLLVFAVAFYMLKYGSDARKWFLSTINTEGERRLTESFISRVDADLYHVFFGNILVALVTAALGALVFSAIDLFSPAKEMVIPYPILLGVLCGIANLIPIVGMKIVWIPLVFYMVFNAYFNGMLLAQIWFLAASIIGIYVIIDWFPDMVLRPYLSGSKRVKMGLLFFTYIAGGAVFGFSGIIIGPLIVVVTINFFRTVLPEIKKR